MPIQCLAWFRSSRAELTALRNSRNRLAACSRPALCRHRTSWAVPGKTPRAADPTWRRRKGWSCPLRETVIIAQSQRSRRKTLAACFWQGYASIGFVRPSAALLSSMMGSPFMTRQWSLRLSRTCCRVADRAIGIPHVEAHRYSCEDRRTAPEGSRSRRHSARGETVHAVHARLCCPGVAR